MWSLPEDRKKVKDNFSMVTQEVKDGRELKWGTVEIKVKPHPSYLFHASNHT